MIFFFILLTSVIVAIVFLTLFAPEKLPWYRPHLLLDQSAFERSSVGSIRQRPIITEGLGVSDEEMLEKDRKIERLEHLLIEKNSAIEKLQRQLTAEKSHRTEFENVKALMDGEIIKLRAQNKELKGE